MITRSENPERLARAHRRRIDSEEARLLLEALLGGRDIPFELNVGRAKKRSWGGVRLRSGTRIGYVSLPGKGGGLTVGSVTHEAAHVIGIWMGSSLDHGQEFVELLDALIAEAESIIRDVPSTGGSHGP